MICLGMTLVNPGEDLLKRYDLPAEYPGPIITQVRDRSRFPKGTAPSVGCAFWMVEHPGKGFPFHQAQLPSHKPVTVHELRQAILSCAVSPDAYQKLLEQSARECRQRADAMGDDPAERKRLLEISEARMPRQDAGKHICRVVYHCPGNQGTMTTHIRLGAEDLEQLRGQ